MRKLIGILLMFLFAAMLLTACSGGSGGDGTNSSPVANAGTDQNVMVGWLVTLDGSGSRNASTYNWSLTTPAGSTATLSSPTASRPTFTADAAGTYTISLVVNNGTVDSSPDTVVVTAVVTRPVPDTGQDTCYTKFGVQLTCSGSGQDADYNIISQPSYSDPGNGTIIDEVTGLIWQKCTMGKTGQDCSGGTLGAFNWYAASGTVDAVSNPTGTNACGDLNLAGYSDWRLPTDSELLSLVDYSGKFVYAINTNYFPDQQPALYWSSTTYANTFSGIPKAWYQDFAFGYNGSAPKTDSGRVRCVRGTPSGSGFVDNNDGTITDIATSLMWQTHAYGTQMDWLSAISYCEGLSFAEHNDWRLPNIKELRSIAYSIEYSPALNQNYFTDTPTQLDNNWSSTTFVEMTNSIWSWTVNFIGGSVDHSMQKTYTYGYARCVRSLP